MDDIDQAARTSEHPVAARARSLPGPQRPPDPIPLSEAVGARGHYSGMVHRLFSGRVAEWQTRWLQVPVSFGTWGFKSPFAHHCD
jgi:hypothetical protein